MESATGRRVLLIIVSGACSLALPGPLSAQYQSPSSGSATRDPYSQQIRETYNFRFGKNNMSAPGNAAVEDNVHSARRVSVGGILRPLPSGSVQPMAPGAAFQLISHALLSHQCQYSAAHQRHRIHAPLR